MSGGTFNYEDYRLFDIKRRIQDEIDYNDIREEPYSAKTIARFQEAVELLERASTLVHRIDWLVACDDDEDDFHRRLDEDFDK